MTNLKLFTAATLSVFVISTQLHADLPQYVAHETSCSVLQTAIKESDLKLTFKTRNWYGRKVVAKKVVSAQKPDCFYPDVLEREYYRTLDNRNCALGYRCSFEMEVD